MKKLIITTDTFISGTPVFVGELVNVDNADANNLLLCNRAEPFDAKNEKHAKLIAEREAAVAAAAATAKKGAK